MGWQWHQLDHMQIIYTTLQTDSHASTPPLNFLQAGCPSRRPTNSVKALKGKLNTRKVALNPKIAQNSVSHSISDGACIVLYHIDYYFVVTIMFD